MKNAIIDNISDTDTVTPFHRNSHCVICGTPFTTARMGKLYCSAKCKQFGYNHKDKIFQSENIAGTGINAKPQTFYLDEFQFYDKRRKMLKRYKELENKQTQRELADCEISNCEKAGIPANNYTWQNYVSKKLTDNEEGELYDLDTEIEEEIKSLNLKEISIEQWSFIKSLYPDIEGISLCELITSLSKGFFSQLNLSPTDHYDNENVTIKNKFINHCNLIAEGVIRFVKMNANDGNEN
ncbi:MAG TPA: hypothetical protein VMU83_13880 [Hanamia sp.]|nr:hypothetical protein [Hanamia sp.]